MNSATYYARADSQLQPALHVIIAMHLAESGPGYSPSVVQKEGCGCGGGVYHPRGSGSSNTPPAAHSTCFLPPVRHHGCRKLVGHLDSGWQPSSMHLPSVGHHGCLTMHRDVEDAGSSANARAPSILTSPLG